MSKETKCQESFGFNVRDKHPDPQIMSVLTGEGGPLAPGACPGLSNVSEKGETAVHGALSQQATLKPKRKSKGKNGEEEKAEEMKPKTPKEEANEKRGEILKASADARKYAISLKQLNYAGELVAGLLKFSDAMEKIYGEMSTLISSGVDEAKKYKSLMSTADSQLAWYKQAEARFTVSVQHFQVFPHIPSILYSALGKLCKFNTIPLVAASHSVVSIPVLLYKSRLDKRQTTSPYHAICGRQRRRDSRAECEKRSHQRQRKARRKKRLRIEERTSCLRGLRGRSRNSHAKHPKDSEKGPGSDATCEA